MDISQNAKFALVIAGAKAQTSSDKRRQLGDFLASLENDTKQVEGTITIHDNVWLIPLSNGLPFLGFLTKWASTTGIRLHILFLEQEPDWIKYPPDEPDKA